MSKQIDDFVFTQLAQSLTRSSHSILIGPMKKQMGDYGVFWAMVWQQKVEKIVMVTKLKEEGVRAGLSPYISYKFTSLTTLKTYV